MLFLFVHRFPTPLYSTSGCILARHSLKRIRVICLFLFLPTPSPFRVREDCVPVPPFARFSVLFPHREVHPVVRPNCPLVAFSGTPLVTGLPTSLLIPVFVLLMQVMQDLPLSWSCTHSFDSSLLPLFSSLPPLNWSLWCFSRFLSNLIAPIFLFCGSLPSTVPVFSHFHRRLLLQSAISLPPSSFVFCSGSSFCTAAV